MPGFSLSPSFNCFTLLLSCTDCRKHQALMARHEEPEGAGGGCLGAHGTAGLGLSVVYVLWSFTNTMNVLKPQSLHGAEEAGSGIRSWFSKSREEGAGEAIASHAAFPGTKGLSLHLSLSPSSISNCLLMAPTHSSSSLAQLNTKQLQSPEGASSALLRETHVIWNGLWSRHGGIPAPPDRS